jgi:hypothetical protein
MFAQLADMKPDNYIGFELKGHMRVTFGIGTVPSLVVVLT